jgi:hypothetical protein
MGRSTNERPSLCYTRIDTTGSSCTRISNRCDTMQKLARDRWRYTRQDLMLLALLLLLASLAAWLGVALPAVLIAGSILLVFVLLLIVSYSLNLRHTHTLRQRILAGDIWAHWRYQGGEWERLRNNPHIHQQLARQTRLWAPILRRNAIVMGSFFTLVLGYMLRTYGWQGLLLAVVIGGGVFGLNLRSARRTMHTLRDPYPQQAGDDMEVYVSSTGMIYGDNHITFARPQLRITQVALEPENPQMIQMRVVYQMGRGGDIPYDVFIPVPDGQAAEAQLLVQRMQTSLVKSA